MLFRSDGPVVASAIHIEGPVTVGEQTIAVGTHIRTGQQVRTGPGGRLRFGLIGGGTIELNERTVLVLESPQIANATQTDAAAASRVRVERGEVFVDAMALAQYEPVELAASGIVASVDRGAMLNMRVEPVEFARSSGGASIRGLFSRGGGGAGLLHLPLAMTPLPQLAGADTSARVEIAVLAGQVTVKAAGGQTRELQANEHLSYDPTTASWQVSSVRAERFALWRMDGNELLRAAEPLLPRLFAGRSRLLDDGRIEIRYDWSLPSQLRDWQMTGLDDSQLSVYREALRIRGSAGAAGAAGEQRGQLHHVMATGGLVELSYELTTDPRQDWRAGVGIKLHAHDDGRSPEPTGASAAFEQHSDGPSAIAEFSPDGSSVSWSEKTARLAESSVPVQGVIGDGRLQLRVANRTAVDQRLSDELNRGVSPAGDGRGNMVTVYMEVRGQDVFVDDVVIRGRPDARWLRTALGEVLERMEQTGR